MVPLPPHRRLLAPRVGLLASAFVLAAAPTLSKASSPAPAQSAADRPPSWDMTQHELEAIGLGQSRGTPVPVPPEILDLLAPQRPHKAEPGVIFVNFDGAEMAEGQDDAAADQTQVPGMGGPFAPYGAGDKRAAVMQAVASDWEAYDVFVTDTRPETGFYTMNMTGPTNPFGGGVLGIAPLDCNDMQPNNVTFAFHGADDMFSAAVTATTIGQEVAHSYGLEHVDAPQDIMNPSNAGGDASFVDECFVIVGGAMCGAQHAEQCASPQEQNSHRELLELFGPSEPDASPPTVLLVAPLDEEFFEPGTDIEIVVEADDGAEGSGVASVRLFNQGEAIQIDTSAPYGWTLSSAPEGTYELYVEATDVAGNVAESNTVTVYVGTEPPSEAGGTDTEGDAGQDGAVGGCGCRSGPGESPLRWGWLPLLGLAALRRRTRRVTR